LNLLKAVVEKNMQIVSDYKEMAVCAFESMKMVSSIVKPLIEEKEKERLKLKRMISERSGDDYEVMSLKR
jgi:hypothetical protein